MMKNLKLSLLLVCIYSLVAFTATGLGMEQSVAQDSLSAYTGKYQMQQGMQTTFADVYIEKGKLLARSSTGELLALDRIGGDNFMIVGQNVPVKFTRDKNNKIVQISVNGNIAWTRVQNQLPSTTEKLFNPADFLGKYQKTVSGQALKIEVSLKNGQLWATQLWDGGSSKLDYVSADKFIVNALSVPMSFIRNKNNEVIQLLFNNHDVFTKVKN